MESPDSTVSPASIVLAARSQGAARRRRQTKRYDDGGDQIETTFGIREAGGRVKNDEATVGRCGHVIEKIPHLYPVPHDQDPVASVRVSKGCTTWLVCI
jgi:hypothetical protein